jgi:hypothetical protein
MCCSKVILDEPDPNDDQVLIDKALAARRNNRIHCNVAATNTESFPIDKRTDILKNVSKANFKVPRPDGMDDTHKNYVYKLGNDII